MEYQLAYLSRIKDILLKQFYLNGTSNKMVDGVSSEDYDFFLEHTRMPGMVELLGELKLYCSNGTGNPKFDLSTTYNLVSEINKKLTTIQLGTKDLAAVFKSYPKEHFTTYTPQSTEELISLLKKLHGNIKPKSKGKKRVSKQEKRQAKKMALKVKIQRIQNKLKFFKDEITKENRFVALDFEAFEWNQKRITEVGFSVFENDEYQNFHYIIKENINRRNGKFVPDNKDRFSFGESEVLPLNEALERLSHILSTADYLVGHGVGNELKWLKKNNVELKQNLKTIDTSILAGGFMKIGGRVSLTRILTFMGIKHDFLHNAGNDSFYTMKVLHQMSHGNLDTQVA
jgi:hypothetical protein